MKGLTGAAELGGDVVLTVLAVLGLLCVASAVAAHLLGYQLVMFSTGSMSPTIPQGSVALTHTVTASELRPGQVVTVHREGQRSLTHRVIAVDAVPGRDSERRLTTQGDANPTADVVQPVVTSGDVVVVSVAGGADIVMLSRQRGVMILASLAAATLILVTFWPRRREDDED